MSETGRMVPAMLALWTAVSARPAMAGVDVVDGPPLDWASVKLPVPQQGDGRRYLFVGAAPDNDEAATSEQDFNAAGAVSRDERLTIVCSALGFGSTIPEARAVADELLAEVERTIRDDVTLGGVVLYSRVSAVEKLDQQHNDRGSSVTLVFRVACRAYLS